MPEPIIKTIDLEVTYNLGKSNEYKALHGETLDIYPGEYVILFGPSGCGKSTLLYTILGSLPPSGGEIYVKGENPYSYDAMRMVQYQRSTVGIIYQSFNLISSLNVVDNVALPMIFASISPAERERRAMVLLKQFGVEHVAHKLSSHLSGGQSQRVAVARSLINDPEILIADEPVGNLDSISAEQVMDMLADINEKGKKTVILVTHDAKYLPYAHRVFYVRDGRLEREVPNPEKPQLKRSTGKGVVTEIERLARIYPYDSPDELRVKSIVNYLTQDITFEQIERLQKLIKMMIEGRMNERMFYDSLCERYENGGVGVARALGETLTHKMRRLMTESLTIKRFRRKDAEPEGGGTRQRYTQMLRRNLLDTYSGDITRIQLERLEDAISARISGILRKEGFENKLEQAIEDEGVGFERPWAHSFAVYLEKLLAQGVRQ
jgi:putative ABC transport system ATP-binding protein